MRYKIFWYSAIPLVLAAVAYEWMHGVRTLVGLAVVLSIVISYVWNGIWEWRENAKAREQARLALLCKHGNPRFKSCKPCAEEFAYWEVCKLCGASWDTRKEKHEHTLHVDQSSGFRAGFPAVMSHYSSQMSMSMMQTSYSYLTASYPMSSLGYVSGHPMVSGLGRGAECRMSR